jgi:anthranilate phosphoribosyltransferase
MSISRYLKVIGRGKDGAQALNRDEARDLFGQVLDGHVTDLEIGAFCLAMRIKGETPAEMAGFLDATHARLCPATLAPSTLATGHREPTVVVLPSYNGARRLPVLTPLLGLLLARAGATVLVHGTATEDNRTTSAAVFTELGLPLAAAAPVLTPGTCTYLPTEAMSPGLKRLLEVRRQVGLRNSAHSLVKLMNPCRGQALIVACYTHPEYATSMADTLGLMGMQALLLRGTEGEPVADARRTPQMDAFYAGERFAVQAAQVGSLTSIPALPKTIAADATAAFINDTLSGKLPVPTPIALQVNHILRELQRAPALADARQTQASSPC